MGSKTGPHIIKPSRRKAASIITKTKKWTIPAHFVKLCPNTFDQDRKTQTRAKNRTAKSLSSRGPRRAGGLDFPHNVLACYHFAPNLLTPFNRNFSGHSAGSPGYLSLEGLSAVIHEASVHDVASKGRLDLCVKTVFLTV